LVDYNPKSWFSLIFKIHKYGTVSKLLPTMVVLTLITGLYCYVEIEIWDNRYDHTMAFHSLVGFVISLLLVFRTNTAYDRWWEGRKQWGALVNNTRNLSIKLSTKIPKEFTERRQLMRVLITNYVFAMKEHLRHGVKEEELEEYPGFDRNAMMQLEHVPNGIAQQLYSEIMKLREDNLLTDEQLVVIDREFKSLTDIIGACERIKKTPIPYSYNAFIKKFIFLYVVSLPFGAITSFGYATIFIVVFLFYILASLEIIAEEIEDPFGIDANDLPTDSLSETIKRNLIELFV
jgi:putative membrane protein